MYIHMSAASLGHNLTLLDQSDGILIQGHKAILSSSKVLYYQ